MNSGRSAVFSAGMRTGAVGSLTTAAGLMVVAGAASAGAATACPSGATEVAAGVCSVTMTSSGSFTAPEGVTTLEALLVGGGGAGAYDDESNYTGGAAGAITYVQAVGVASPIAVTVGLGGVSSVAAEGDTSGDGTTTSINDGTTTSTAVGGGFHAATGATGTTASTFVSGAAGTVSLWPAFGGETCFADDGEGGGGPVSFSAPFATAHLSCGGGVQGDGTVAAGVAGTGSGGAATAFNGDESFWVNGGNGGSGFVIFRYPMAQVFEDTLAATGPASAGLGWASAALVALGVALMGASRRLRRVTMV